MERKESRSIARCDSLSTVVDPRTRPRHKKTVISSKGLSNAPPLRVIHPTSTALLYPRQQRQRQQLSLPPPLPPRITINSKMATAAASVVSALADRPVKNTIVLFDVDGTLTPARRVRGLLLPATSHPTSD
nr:hypothetical protein CFP56_04163 [Quercus suber]